MNKPDFLDTPAAWMRTPRTHQSPCEYACAIERKASAAERRALCASWLLVDLVTAVGLLGLLAYVLFTWGQ